MEDAAAPNPFNTHRGFRLSLNGSTNMPMLECGLPVIMFRPTIENVNRWVVPQFRTEKQRRFASIRYMREGESMARET